MSTQIIGRFAPSPTGRLHLGSLTTAIASYCYTKSLGAKQINTKELNIRQVSTKKLSTNLSDNTSANIHAKWLLRIEDVDIQRCKPEFSNSILHDLTNLGLNWDGEVFYQSKRTQIYNQILNDKLKSITYACDCSRKSLRGHVTYPRNCINKQRDRKNHKIRIHLPNHLIGFLDGIRGMQWQNPQVSLGDMVVRRGVTRINTIEKNIINYILAVSIDDSLQNVSHVMRGLDILPMTSAQIAIMSLIDTHTIQNWCHLPLVTNQFGQKLSKQNFAQAIDTTSERKCSELITTSLQFLQQPKVDIDTSDRMLQQAVAQWSNLPLKQHSY